MIFPPWCGGHCAVLRVRRERRSPVTSFGGHSEGETPLPIPNREVKPLSADGTWPARAWESRSPPFFTIFERAVLRGGSFSVWIGSRLHERHGPDPEPVGRHRPAPSLLRRGEARRRAAR